MLGPPPPSPPRQVMVSVVVVSSLLAKIHGPGQPCFMPLIQALLPWALHHRHAIRVPVQVCWLASGWVRLKYGLLCFTLWTPVAAHLPLCTLHGHHHHLTGTTWHAHRQRTPCPPSPLPPARSSRACYVKTAGETSPHLLQRQLLLCMMLLPPPLLLLPHPVQVLLHMTLGHHLAELSALMGPAQAGATAMLDATWRFLDGNAELALLLRRQAVVDLAGFSLGFETSIEGVFGVGGWVGVGRAVVVGGLRGHKWAGSESGSGGGGRCG